MTERPERRGVSRRRPPADAYSAAGLLIHADALQLRASLRPVVWMVLEDLALDAAPLDGKLVAGTSARRIAGRLGLDPGGVSSALKILRDRKFVELVPATGAAGRFGLMVYALTELPGVEVLPCTDSPQTVEPHTARAASDGNREPPRLPDRRGRRRPSTSGRVPREGPGIGLPGGLAGVCADFALLLWRWLVLTVTALTNAEYLLSSVALGIDEYYAGVGEAPGVWSGRWSPALGLEGTVDGRRIARHGGGEGSGLRCAVAGGVAGADGQGVRPDVLGPEVGVGPVGAGLATGRRCGDERAPGSGRRRRSGFSRTGPRWPGCRSTGCGAMCRPRGGRWRGSCIARHVPVTPSSTRIVWSRTWCAATTGGVWRSPPGRCSCGPALLARSTKPSCSGC